MPSPSWASLTYALQKDAEAQANEVRLEADRYAREQKQSAQQEVSRLELIGTETRAELAKLHELLGAEIGSGVGSAGPSAAAPDG
jgi:hypothetical protein